MGILLLSSAVSRLNSFLRSSTSSPEPENNNSDVIKSKSCYWARVGRVAKDNGDRGQMVSTARRIVICSDSYYNNYKIQGKGGLDPSLIPDPTCGVDIRLSPTIRFVKKDKYWQNQRQRDTETKIQKRKVTMKWKAQHVSWTEDSVPPSGLSKKDKDIYRVKDKDVYHAKDKDQPTCHVCRIDIGLSFFLLLLSSLTMERIMISMLSMWMIPKSNTIAHHLWEERHYI